MKVASTQGAAVRGKILAGAVRALSGPVGGSTLLMGGDRALLRALDADLENPAIFQPDPSAPIKGAALFDLILLADGAEAGGVGDIRSRIAATAGRLGPGGALVIYLGSLGAPVSSADIEGEGGAYDHLLFPEAALAGDMGPSVAARTPLAVSTWLLMFRSLGLEVSNHAGLGDHIMPAALMTDHQARLAVFDPVELSTGQWLVVLRRRVASL